MLGLGELSSYKSILFFKHCSYIDNKLADVLSRVIATLHTMNMTIVGFDWFQRWICHLSLGIFQDVKNGNHHNLIDFVIQDGYLLRVHAYPLCKWLSWMLLKKQDYCPYVRLILLTFIATRCCTDHVIMLYMSNCKDNQTKHTITYTLWALERHYHGLCLELYRTNRSHDLILVVADQFLKMIHFILCNKTNERSQ